MTNISISLNSPFELTFANGTKIKYDGVNLETSDENEIADYNIISDENYAYLSLNVNSTNQLKISGTNIDVSASINNKFYMAKVNNAENVVFDASNGLKINGDDFDFDIAVDTDLKATSLIEVSGSAHGNVTVNDSEEEVRCHFDGYHGNLSVNAYEDSGSGITNINVEKKGDFSICDDSNNENPIINTESTIFGDANGDGKVNGKDATRLMQYLAGWDVEIDQSAADVNGDGKVNGKDATRLMQYLAGWDVTLGK